MRTSARPVESVTDRQERISWWSQDKLRQARVMIVGAGALGNEVIKNLALVGIGYMVVVDCDTIEISNLSRTALFRREDLGRRKAVVAAQRGNALNVEPSACLEALDADLVWEVGLGLYRRVDVVLGCLDNLEARLAVNRACLLTGRPLIDGGIRELAGSVYVFQPPFPSCFSCATTRRERAAARARYDSCFQTLRRSHAQGRLATVQVSSALIAALQCELALKWLHQRLPLNGVRLQYDGSGSRPYFDTTTVFRRPHCECEALRPLPDIATLAGSRRTCTLRGLLARLQAAGLEGATVKFPGSFVAGVECLRCGRYSPIRRPLYRLHNEELQCHWCRRPGDREGLHLHYLGDSLEVLEADATGDQPPLQDLPLEQLGFPSLHVYDVQDCRGGWHYFELADDLHEALPDLARRLS
ncbi:MAG: ThiF family adenylyltransferase [candidate division KSB1 bacterium]|nr:ThiF family adenylyltransferase [candidate division KSB1 bacterium]MDZ7272853.1 ThiF family adenylyltransferase [candidate division KSB1 bacterium]MDZ7284124.1 ThiF family adenylyltransferase [candidate division KSB1 bacterium]MDZ7297478.1 ThiF family adenylyltransferase [candidate division KSB1 bacterium]MDZ7305614.1 ThiF family adenylyltransferase [candidate division KSB1 bacterium]